MSRATRTSPVSEWFGKVVLLTARRTPRFIKRWLHNNRVLDRVTRQTFSKLVAIDSRVATMRSGPLAGLKLVFSEHVSRADISGLYELEVQRSIDRYLPSGSICYDIGASIGYMSLLMARRARHVYAFEPAPHAANELRKHVRSNGFDNITLVPTPVSDSHRPVVFSLTDNAYGPRIVEGPSRWPISTLTTTTLDAFAATHPLPGFIKMDVEGEEGRVLRGAGALLERKAPTICCELHSEEAAQEVLDVLLPRGYRVTRLDGRPFTGGPVVPGEVHVMAVPPGYGQ